MRIDEILEKYQLGDPITDEELDFILDKIDKICHLTVDFPREFLLFRRELWKIQDSFSLMKISRQAKNIVLSGENK